MSSAKLDEAARELLRAELESVGGVRRAVIDGDASLLVYLICERSETEPTEALARSILADHGFVGPDVSVQLAYVPREEARRRVRFVAAVVSQPRPGRARAEVELEWAGESYREEIEGEGGVALELRLAALATLRSLHGILGGRVTFELVGIKGFKAFDADVIVAVLRTRTGDGRALIGAALATDNAHRSAALAVLNATNRILGNYLSHSQD
jgi:hypothetical protein